MRRNASQNIALGGVLAALALVIMCLGTMIPIATFVCPMLCAVLLLVVLRRAGRRIAWAWYGAVAILSLLLAPDKEAGAVFVFFGYYPIIKPRLDRKKLALLWKLILFNVSIFAMYGLLIYLLGWNQIMAEFKELGTVMTLITLILGNITLFMLDVLLGRVSRLLRRKR